MRGGCGAGGAVAGVGRGGVAVAGGVGRGRGGRGGGVAVAGAWRGVAGGCRSWRDGAKRAACRGRALLGAGGRKMECSLLGCQQKPVRLCPGCCAWPLDSQGPALQPREAVFLGRDVQTALSIHSDHMSCPRADPVRLYPGCALRPPTH